MPEPLATLFECAHRAWDAGNLARARELFERGVAVNDPGSLLSLGYFYDEGVGVSADKARAMDLYKRAYRRGDAAAASNIAILYRKQGRYRLCFQWFVRAAKLQDGDAEVELAKLYASGIGVSRSSDLALQAAKRARASKYITPAGREEANELLARLRSAA